MINFQTNEKKKQPIYTLCSTQFTEWKIFWKIYFTPKFFVVGSATYVFFILSNPFLLWKNTVCILHGTQTFRVNNKFTNVLAKLLAQYLLEEIKILKVRGNCRTFWKFQTLNKEQSGTWRKNRKLKFQIFLRIYVWVNSSNVEYSIIIMSSKLQDRSEITKKKFVACTRAKLFC